MDLSPDTSPRRDGLGRVLREVIRQAWPNILASASVTVMHFVDVTLVSWLGKPQLASVSNAGVIVFALFCLAGGVAGCVSTFAAQSLGRGQPRDSSAYAWQNAFFGLAVGVAVLPLIPLAPAFYAWVGHAPDVQACMVDYTQVRLCGVGFGVCTWGFCSYFQGIQRPWVAMTTTIVGNVFNVLASCVLIFGLWGFPAYGIRGAALGTVLALAFQTALLIGFLVHPRFARHFGGWETCRVEWDKLHQLLHIGWPAGLTLALDIGSWAIFNNALIGRFGTDALAGNTAAVQYMHLSFAVLLGLGHAATALVGKYVGMGDTRGARRRATVALALAEGAAVLMGGLFLVFRVPLARHFSDDPRVVAAATTILLFAALFQCFRAAQVVCSGALRGAGDTRWVAVVSVGLAWFVFLPAGAALAYGVPALGPAGPWLGGIAYISLLASTLWWRLASERWTRIDIFRVRAAVGAEPAPTPREAP